MKAPSDSTLDACRLVDVGDLSTLLKLSARTIWREAAKAEAGIGSFPRAITIAGGRLRRWRLQDVRRYLDGLTGEGTR